LNVNHAVEQATSEKKAPVVWPQASTHTLPAEGHSTPTATYELRRFESIRVSPGCRVVVSVVDIVQQTVTFAVESDGPNPNVGRKYGHTRYAHVGPGGDCRLDKIAFDSSSVPPGLTLRVKAIHENEPVVAVYFHTLPVTFESP
jgi:hypothetical protein